MPLTRTSHSNGESNRLHVDNKVEPEAVTRPADVKRRKARTMAKQQQAAERISAASTELSASIGEATAAVIELRKSMEVIASGAAEAASATQESQAAITQVAGRIQRQSDAALRSEEKTNVLQELIAGAAQNIDQLVDNVRRGSERQAESVGMMTELQKQAANINDAVKQVIRIADQTNLLALNAAIEAARAGRHGKGFAVVADAVRGLAENSEKNAASIEELVNEIQNTSSRIAENVKKASEVAKTEADKGKMVTEVLSQIREDMLSIAEGCQELTKGAAEMNVAGEQSLTASTNIAAAAEEQSSCCDQSLKILENQGRAMDQASRLSGELDELSEELKISSDIVKSAEGVASVAEELSASVERITLASTEIQVSIKQISDGAGSQEQQCEESAAGIAQIESGVKVAESRSQDALSKCQSMSELIAQNKDAVDSMISGIGAAMNEGRENLKDIMNLEQVSLRIDKIVDAIGNVAIQTSMLAVSGAVEAARAGEYGKGFAVVSTDIQNLANDAAENAETIKDQVKTIQEQLAAVRVDLSEVSDNAVSEVEKARSTTSTLDTIEVEMGVVLESNHEINRAAIEIAAGIEQARKGVAEISKGAQQSKRAAGEASAAAAQQAEGAKELAAAIEEIASVADELQQGN